MQLEIVSPWDSVSTAVQKFLIYDSAKRMKSDPT